MIDEEFKKLFTAIMKESVGEYFKAYCDQLTFGRGLVKWEDGRLVHVPYIDGDKKGAISLDEFGKDALEG